MKRLNVLISLVCAASMMPLAAQNLKEGYINCGVTGSQFRISNWHPVEDDNFYISRVAPKARFSDKTTQVLTQMVPWWTWTKGTALPAGKFSRKLLMWTPCNFITDDYPYGVLPNGTFNNEVFTMWQYVTHYGLWSSDFMHVPGNFADVAHKNGVAVSTHFASKWQDNMNEWGQVISDFRYNSYALKDYLKKYGFESIGYNSEWSSAVYNSDVSSLNLRISSFNTERFAQLTDPATAKVSFQGENIWYDGVNEQWGQIFDNGVCDNTANFFGNNDNIRSSFFLNYNWNGNQSDYSKGIAYLDTSVNYVVNSMNRNPFDMYAGFNLQAQEPYLTNVNPSKFKGENQRWTYWRQYPVSVGLWSGHNTNVFWEARNARGSKDLQAQLTYQKTIERWFTNSKNGISNPIYAADANLPVDESLSNDINTDFFGMSKFIEAQSTLCWDLAKEPFITYFNVGNGQFFNWMGRTQHKKEWYNIGIQDYMPTWRWWWSSKKLGRKISSVTTGLTAEFAWNDAWFGGSSLKISGTDTDKNPDYLHLFKTRFALQKGDTVTVRYKVYQGGADLSLVLGYGSDRKGTNCKIWDEDEASDDDAFKIMTKGDVSLATWNVKKIVIPETVNDNLAVIALRFDNAEKLNMNIGEISVKRGSYPVPASPKIIKGTLLGFNMKGVDGKITYTMDETETKRYNIDHNVSFFKIYAKITYSDNSTTTTLMGATTSWAGIFFEAPYDKKQMEHDGTLSIGVSAVGLDGVSESKIAWQEAGILSYNDIASQVNYSVSDDIKISSDFVTNGETFIVRYADPRHKAADKWELYGPLKNTNISGVAPKTITYNGDTGFSAVASVNSQTVEFGALPAGFYNLKVTSGNSVRNFNALVQVFDPSVGKPKIEKFVALDRDGNSPLISEVSAETAASIKFSEFPNSTFLWADERIQPALNEEFETLPGAGVKVYQNDNDNKTATMPLRLFYQASSKSTGDASNAARLDDKALGVVAKSVGLKAANQSFTVAFWIKLMSINANSWILNIRTPEKDVWPKRAWGWLWTGIDKHGNYTNTTISGPSEVVYNYNNWKFEKNAWYHMAYVFNNASDSYELYVNGQKITPSSTVPGGWGNFRGIYTIGIGGIAGKGAFAGFDGIVDNFQIYNKALSADEVVESMKEKIEKSQNLVGFWDFEPNADGKTYDDTKGKEGYFNKSGKFPDARLVHHFYPTDPGDKDLQQKVLVSSKEHVGYPAFTGGARNVAVKPEYEIVGCKHYNILPVGTADVSKQIAGTPYSPDSEIEPIAGGDASITVDADGQCGYADITFPDPGPNCIKVYTCKLILDNGLGTAESIYRYIYVTRQKSEIVTSVEDAVSEAGTVRVFPNPVTDNMYVAVDENGEYRVRMTDLSGRTVLETAQHADAGECITVNADVPAGTYLVQVSKDGIPAAMQKIIKKQY